MANKILYFEGAGWEEAASSKATIGNCRVRTAFHLDDGRPFYCELTCNPHRSKRRGGPVFYGGWINSLHLITDEFPNDDENRYSLLSRIISHKIDYTEEGILQFINSIESGASFDAIKVLPRLSGYRVFRNPCAHRGTERVNYGDEFRPDPSLIALRHAIHGILFTREINNGNPNPSISIWVDDNDQNLLHIQNHNLFSFSQYRGGGGTMIIRTDAGSDPLSCLATMKEDRY